MPSRPKPILLTSKSIPGTISSTHHSNLNWNDDGQCLILHKKAITIATPYLATTLPPPPTYLDLSKDDPPPTQPPTNSKPNPKGKNKAIDDEALPSDDEGMDNVDPSLPSASSGSTGKRVRKAKLGEVRFYMTVVEVEKGKGREEFYGWGDVGDEYSYVTTERERYLRAAIWSPSGLNDLGGCLLVVMTSFFQVSVYAPRNDPYTKQYVEIADLTMKTKDLLEKREVKSGIPSITAMLEMRATSMKWSSSLPLSSMLGIDGSLLALANRAGKLALWSYGPMRRFERVSYFKIGDGWAVDMAFSPWDVVDSKTCKSRLALAMTDGSVVVVDIIRRVEVKDGKQGWGLEIGDGVVVGGKDKRSIAAVKWVQNGILVWTKPGSVHLWSDGGLTSWNGVRDLRFEKVGDWAGCNAMSPVIGIHQPSPETLLLTTSALTIHLLQNLLTSPSLSPSIDSLAATLNARDIFINYVKEDWLVKNRFRVAYTEDRGFGAFTSSFQRVGGWGNVVSWIGEPTTFHNLDSATEGVRTISLLLADLGRTIPSSQSDLVLHLTEVFKHPPNLLAVPPFTVLTGGILHIVGSLDPLKWAQPLLDLLNDLPMEEDSNPATGDSPSKAVSGEATDKGMGLMADLWGDAGINGLRLRLVLSTWCSRFFADQKAEFESIVTQLTARIDTLLRGVMIRWAASSLKQGDQLHEKDRRFLNLLLQSATPTRGIEEPSRKLQAILYTPPPLFLPHADESMIDAEREGEGVGGEKCPACGEEVVIGDKGAICKKGHEWARCSITNFLITNPHYKVCSSCTAISLLPAIHTESPRPVDFLGKDRDHLRFLVKPALGGPPGGDTIGAGEGRMVQIVLECGVGCLICGGRWVRAI